MSTKEEQVAVLTDKLSALENESRRLLTALRWAGKVRMVLLACLLLFVLISGVMFYRLYNDIKTNRIEEVRRIIRENPEDFSEPLTRQVMLLAEEHGPSVVEVFREQAQQDSQQYLDAFDAERTKLIANLQVNLEQKLNASYSNMLSEHEQMLKEEFPVLKDPAKLENIRLNMEKVYDKIGKRYLVDSLREEMESIANKVDSFPASQPKQDNIPLGEQIATELLELVRLMLVNSENYVVPTDMASAQTSSEGKGDGPSSVSLDIKDNEPGKPPTPDENLTESKNDDDSAGKEESVAEVKDQNEKSSDKDESSNEDESSDEDKTGDEGDSNATANK